MMKDKLETLTILQLRELAKHEGLKKFTALNKQDLVSLLVKHYEAKVEEVLEEEKNIDAPKTLYKEEPMQHTVKKQQNDEKIPVEMRELDSGIIAHGILEVMPDGFGFIRCENFLPGDNDVYVAPSQIKRFKLKTGDIISGSRRVKASAEKFAALLYVQTVNGYRVSELEHRPNFEDLTPIFPDKRIPLSNYPNTPTSMRVMDIISPIGKGQRGMIVSPPKAGKTTLLKEVAKAVLRNEPDMNIIILLIDERPEEVTDIKEAITGEQVEVIYSTFDELQAEEPFQEVLTLPHCTCRKDFSVLPEIPEREAVLPYLQLPW